tara:strand:+ start:4166 stop:4750 length:585 start_codon:yes stop_codon:yes gene_type:complete
MLWKIDYIFFVLRRDFARYGGALMAAEARRQGNPGAELAGRLLVESGRGEENTNNQSVTINVNNGNQYSQEPSVREDLGGLRVYNWQDRNGDGKVDFKNELQEGENFRIKRGVPVFVSMKMPMMGGKNIKVRLFNRNSASSTLIDEFRSGSFKHNGYDNQFINFGPLNYGRYRATWEIEGSNKIQGEGCFISDD